jgi:hypothetical protein
MDNKQLNGPGAIRRDEMMSFSKHSWSVFLILATLLVVAAKARSAELADSAVDLFQAKKERQIAVKLIPHDAKTGTVTITNLTKEQLTIKLPEAFAGVPVLAQRGGGGIGGNNHGGGRSVSQGLGGGFGGGFGGGGLGGGGGFFNIGPERVAKIKIASVCLEHGKADPNPRIPYELVPIDEFTANANVVEVVKLLGQAEIRQAAAQAAAWHLANGLSWEQLAGKIGIQHLNGTSEPFFSPGELERAAQIVEVARSRAARYEWHGKSSSELSLAAGN